MGDSYPGGKAALEANRETVEIAQPFTGFKVFCHHCRKTLVAPWVPARCLGCKKLLTRSEDE